MAFVNIPRDRDDPNYRYKMPRLMSKIEGRGNGIKTNIANMGEIAKALKRPPMYPTKFFGCELGAMAKFEDAEEKAIINGAHLEKDLLSILDKFIEMYVLCPGCHLPEFDISVKKGCLYFRCNACGHQGDLDMAHKAATYMIRNPPDQSSSTLGKKKKTKEERRIEKNARRQKTNGDSSEEEEVEEKKEKKKEKKEKKEKKSKKEKEEKSGSKRSPNNSMSKDGASGEEGGVDDSDPDISPAGGSSGAMTPCDQTGATEDKNEKSEKIEKSEKSEKIEKSEKSEKRKGATADQVMFHEVLQYDSPELEDVVNRLSAFLQTSESVGVGEFFQEVRLLQVSQDFNGKCRLYVALCALFGDSLTANGLESKVPFVKKVVDSSMKQEEILDCVEHFCHDKSPSTFSQFPYIIQKLYAAEILESEDILKYYGGDRSNPIFSKCKKIAEPFLAWLRDNESEEESEDEEYVKPTHTAPTLKSLGHLQNSCSADDLWVTASTTPNTTKAGEDDEMFHDAHENSVEEDGEPEDEEEEDDDVDIDNI